MILLFTFVLLLFIGSMLMVLYHQAKVDAISTLMTLYTELYKHRNNNNSNRTCYRFSCYAILSYLCNNWFRKQLIDMIDRTAQERKIKVSNHKLIDIERKNNDYYNSRIGLVKQTLNQLK